MAFMVCRSLQLDGTVYACETACLPICPVKDELHLADPFGHSIFQQVLDNGPAIHIICQPSCGKYLDAVGLKHLVVSHYDQVLDLGLRNE